MTCRLDVDSPSYPPENQEFLQCGCGACLAEAIRRGAKPCCVCSNLTFDGPISTGDINNPTMKPCCNGCFVGMVCP